MRARTRTALNDGWIFTDKNGVKHPVSLPHTWNGEDGQDGGDDYYRGTCRYTRRCRFQKPADGSRLFLEFPAVAMSAEVFWNGKKIASHDGGYSLFRADITDLVSGDDELTVQADNGRNDRVYPQYADFTFYGGLYRGVNLLTVPENHFDVSYFGSEGLKITPEVQGRDARVHLEAYAQKGEVTFQVAGQEVTAPVRGGKAEAFVTIPDVHLWNGKEDPYLYLCTARLSGGDCVSARFGCRTVAIDPDKGFLLNGKPYPLRGVSRHQDRPGKGSALSAADHEEDIRLILETGANAVRLAHYQHAQAFYDLCDETGLIVWAEIPYISCHMANGRANTLQQMTELIAQNYNHPSIAVWGLSNEITSVPAADPDGLLENHRALNDLVHQMDPTRPTAIANVFMLETDNPLLTIPDANTYNLYFGWYLGDLQQNDQFFDEYHAKFPDRCIGLSEYGADANPALHSDAPHSGDYSEEYQCIYHEHMLQMISGRPYLWCTFLWNMFDFAADGRSEGGKCGQNQKGIVTFDRKTKKDAFYLYKAWWSDEPFVHLCGRRFADRTGERTQIKVYSNQPEVSLFVDDKCVGKQKGSHVFTFDIPLAGELHIRAEAGAQRDEMVIRKVQEPNPAYSIGAGSVTNWFDKDPINPAFYSVQDKLSDLQASAKAGPIIRKLMAKGSENRGELAKNAGANQALQRMLGRMTLLSLLQKMPDAVSKDDIGKLNETLQTIPKGE
ncbi:MAG: glycoside hydrolase family 2 protein [Lachnospiraceae bacterium]|jgi:beta-galactosidase